MSTVFSKCVECAYLFEQSREEVINNDLCCEAFPNGIPGWAFLARKDVPCTKDYSFEKDENE